MKKPEFKLFLIGFITLLLELALIRYLAGNIWNLGYFPNLVLIAVFVGMGIGFVFHNYADTKMSSILYTASVFCLLFLVVFVHYKHPVVPGFKISNGTFGDELFFASVATQKGGISHLLFLAWFLSIVTIFTLISQRAAKLFAMFSPLKAYTLNIVGSCCGILCFLAMSWLCLPAYSWFLFITPIFILSMEDSSVKNRFLAFLPLICVVLIVYYQDSFIVSGKSKPDLLSTKWSPYQRVDYKYTKDKIPQLEVNGLFHQLLYNIDIITNSFYKIPYTRRAEDTSTNPYKSVLIIGAGTGNDVATALHYGAERVDAVEIDPVIADFGRRYHPEHPYDDPRVNLIVDDGRAFMTNTKSKYDLVIFALTDSLVKTSPLAQLRLENYLFTKESLKRAFGLLNNKGDLYLYNYYRTPWLIKKISTLMFTASGRAPEIVGRNEDFVIFKTSLDKDSKEPESDDIVAKLAIPTDDWPFLYLEKRGMPGIYAKAMAGLTLFVISLMGILHLKTRRRKDYAKGAASYLIKIAFVLMGIAFLLLETKSVVQFSLLFGTTWLNSSMVFFSVLMLVLAANLIAGVVHWKNMLPVVYVLLIVSCFITLKYPLSNLLYYENTLVRFILASLLTFSPIFFANLIFSLTFKGQKIAEHLFGWNMLGATLGGVLEYFSMAIGYNSLTIIVACCYTCVFILLWTAQRLPDSASVKMT